MSDPARPDPSRPEPGASLEIYKPYLALFGVAAAGVALLVVVGGIALAVFMKAGWVLVPLACVIWTLFPLRDLRKLEDGAAFSEGASPGAGGSGPVAAGPGATGAGPGGTGIAPAAEGGEGAGGADGAAGGAAAPTAPGDATGATTAGQAPSAEGPGAGVPSDQDMGRRRAAWDVVRQRAVNALLITFAAWAALILLHLL